MLNFVTIDPERPARRPAEERRLDFLEIDGVIPEAAGEMQASRCAQCGVPFCQSGCPVQNNIPDWLRYAAEGDLRAAYELSAATSTMPEICGRICPQDRLCEGACVTEQSGHGAITIGMVEKFITDHAWAEGWVEPIRPRADLPGSVGIIGAGPAGMSAAELLRREGWRVTIYDRYDRPGGLLIYGIPNFKLDKSVVERRVQRLADAGVQFVTNTDVGKDISFEELRARHDAILIATGVYKARELGAPGSALDGVIPALPFLTHATRALLGDAAGAGANETAAGRDVVVIGGGDTAMDCVRTSVRQGAKSVTCLYRRDRENMPGSAREVKYAEEEGVSFAFLAQPVRLEEGRDGRVGAVVAQMMQLGEPDADGRRKPEPVGEAETRFSADLVIEALGFSPEDLPSMFGAPELTLNQAGALRVKPSTLQTSLPGVYAAGDIMRGASLVVWAIRDGMDAAAAMHADLTARLIRPGRRAA